ncbi:saccharopine dehydrogenase family protein [Desulfobulbus oligotrophicus]|jgi:saccharopine dehydrogenase (NAD+, L-lysine-forming)|uniref:Saccharopine dehydrogenase family protein n=1 Tax=Desulfobulbus oligotrophicus TaxID=1909699 RepID=A0A7T5VB65_9BACT|nr:saccharopine dehydrogenase family protein [Desulfobulbus oligotrophicus]MDY0391139.1 saccharopine dehydrogenase family protein [Desulfobulbus oligotrophicus]QQG64571.1 saccharopine dehydrogenase family protein [Desulfobulbus oligotrophicus]
MSHVLIIGAGGVGSVVAHKCAQVPEVFSRITLASRTLSKCEDIARSVKQRTGIRIAVEQVNADDVTATSALIRQLSPDLVLNVALPYQDLPLMDACLATGVDYLDTANYEPPDVARFEYKWQWAYQDSFTEKGIMALLGSGFDPGVTNVFTAWAAKHHFDEIHQLDIIDCNAGDHGQAFATNFNPEINIREITQRGRYFEHGEWVETDPLSWSMTFDFPEGIGPKKCYLMFHEELESLVRNIKGLKRARFWMTFSDQYLTHLRVLENVGMTRIDPVLYQGQEIVPIRFLKAVLPEPASLGPLTKGRTCIGCLMKGIKDGKEKQLYIYNICSHEEAYREVGSQAISYTTGVPAMIGAKMMLQGLWKRPGVWNMEEFDPDPFMHDLNTYGLPWTVVEL